MGNVPWTLVVSVHNDEDVFQSNLNRSLAVRAAEDVLVQRDFDTVCEAYNDAIDRSRTDVVVFAHPDVYFPEHWEPNFQRVLARVGAEHPEWGVLGLFGCDARGGYVGFAHSIGIGKLIGSPFSEPTPARTVDEFVFIVRKSSGLRFDESLPGPQSQLCATDLCLEAERRGLPVFVIPAFALLNSNGWRTLPLGFWKPYLYVRRKWRSDLPIVLPYARITRLCLPMIKNSVRHFVLGLKGGYRRGTRVPDPEAHFADLESRVRTVFGWNGDR